MEALKVALPPKIRQLEVEAEFPETNSTTFWLDEEEALESELPKLALKPLETFTEGELRTLAEKLIPLDLAD